VTGSWLAGGPAGGTQLFCFAHAGGGPAFYRPWQAQLARAGIAVRPVVLPGRERRLSEPPYRSAADLTPPLCEALEPHLNGPYAFFGHSMGAIVAYEAARRLAAAGRGPACLIVSGHPSPDQPRTRPPVAGLPDAQFAAVVERLGGTPPEVLREPDLLAMLLPVLRADFHLTETYQPLPGARLDCPVYAYSGSADPDAGPARASGWAQVTEGAFTARSFSGGHFYLAGARPEVLAAVRADIGRACS